MARPTDASPKSRQKQSRSQRKLRDLDEVAFPTWSRQQGWGGVHVGDWTSARTTQAGCSISHPGKQVLQCGGVGHRWPTRARCTLHFGCAAENAGTAFLTSTDAQGCQRIGMHKIHMFSSGGDLASGVDWACLGAGRLLIRP